MLQIFDVGARVVVEFYENYERLIYNLEMPSYELALIFRALPKPDLKSALKRVAQSVMSQGGILHKIENLGSRQLPFKMKKHQVNYRNGSYFTFYFDSPTELLDILIEEHDRDVDILRHKFCRADRIIKPVSCTLEYELLPPAYRPDVDKLIIEGRKKEKKEFEMHLDYYPF